MKEVVAQGFRLSPQQRRIWRLQSEAENRPYKACCLALLKGVLDADLLRRAAAEVVDRFEILRTTFPCPPGLKLPAQRVGAGGLDWSRLPDAPEPLSSQQREAALEDLFRLAREIVHDIERGPVLSLRLARLAENEHALAMSLPALCADGVALRNLAREILDAYAALAEGRSSAAGDEPPLQYADLAEWQNELLDGEEAAAGREYWAGWNPAVCRSLRLPQETAPARLESFDLQRVPVPLGVEAGGRLAALARSAGVPASTPLLVAFQILLWRLTGETDFTLGLVAEGRSYEGLGDAIGTLATHVPLSCHIDGDLSFSSALERSHAAVEAVAEWQEFFSWERIAARHGLALDETVFPASFEAEEWPAAQDAGPLILSLLRCEASVDRVKLKLAARRVGEELMVEIHYDASQLDRESVEELAQALGVLLAAAAETPELPVARLGLTAQRDPALAHVSPPPTLPLVHELFALQARRVPERTAVACDGRSLTYSELAERARGVARFLAARGVAPGIVVGVALERSIEMVEAILGVLEAGGAYLPIEPGLPRERKAILLERAASRVVVTERRFLSILPEKWTADALCLDDIRESAPAGEPASPGVAVPDASLAYVIYTSGSTGVPKGVGIEHRQLANYVQGIGERLGLPDGASYAMLSSFAADLGNTVLFPPLCTGGCLHLIPPAMAVDSEALAGYFRRHSIDCLKIAPSHLKALMSGAAREALLPLRWLILGGEALRWDWVDELRALAPHCSILNHYGPTEATVGVLTLDVDAVSTRPSRTIPLGRALPHTAVHLLERELEPLPAWFIGELYIGGAGVARGYLERPDLTAESFLPDPLAGVPGARMYRTGDLARRLPDGTFEFLGRADDQVKVRGFRVELGEIEAALESHPAVRRAAVVAHDDEDGGKRLAAYVVAEGHTVGVGELRDFLRERLPDFMLPAALLFLDALPLTASGKVDRRSLPQPEWRRFASGDGFVAPATPEESTLAEIWAEVLRLDRVGIHDDFFQIGGDSIRGIIARSKAEERGLFFTVQDLFERPTIHQLAQTLRPVVKAGADPGGVEAFSLLSMSDRERLPGGLDDAYPLSRMQGGMLFHSELGTGSATFHNLHSFHARMRFEEELLRSVAEELVRRHPVLRTSFDLTSFGEAVQLVHSTVDLPLEIQDLRGLPQAEQEASLAKWLREEAALRPFDWTRPPLFRLNVHRLGEEDLQFTLSFHHAILDGWSVATLLSELIHGYLSRLAGTPPADDPGPVSALRELVASERAAVHSAEVRDFWQRALDGATATSLPRFGQDEDMGPVRAVGRSLSVPIPAELSDALHEAARRSGAPIKSLLLAVHLRVLSLLCGESDVITGLVSHGRPESAEGERALGVFVNTVPLRLRLGGGTWQDLARDAFVRERELFPVRYFPLAELHRIRAGQALFDTAFAFLHYQFERLEGMPGIEILEARSYSESNFPLTVTFSLDSFSGLRLALLYRWPELHDSQVEALGGYYMRALTAAAAAPQARYERADLLGEVERHQLILEWNDTLRAYQESICLHRLIEAQVARTPDATAAVFEGQGLTYADLNRQANALARRLRALGCGPDERVGIVMERSLELVVALLATLKAGAAYVPVDPEYPQSRIEFMLADSRPRVLLTQERLIRGLQSHPGPLICVSPESLQGEDVEDLLEPMDDSSLAYVIYTSGSTGRPKGAMVHHRGICNRLLWMQEAYNLDAADAVLQKTPYSFDVSVWEFFLPLLAGARLVLARPGGHQDSGYLVELIERERVTALHFVPSMLQVFLEEPSVSAGRCGSLRLVIASGEALPPELERRFSQKLDAVLENLYGPTEASVDVTAWTCSSAGAQRSVPIGRPIANTSIHVCDLYGQPAPVGAPGELLIGGRNVGRGYFGRPSLTAERFVPDPFGAPGARLYRTGDLARHRPDGAIEFLGRIDHQVKIRGFRVELGEIEHVLAQHGAVREAIVTAGRDNGTNRLVAYVVPLEGAAVDGGELRAHVRERLPEYMVPAAVVVLPSLPLLANGKMDRAALPAPAASREDLGVDFVPPRTAVERILAGMWREVLKVDRIGVHDDFFALGGDSLSATQTAMRIRKTLGVDLQLRHIMLSRSIAGVAAALLAEPEQREEVERTAELVVRLAEMSDEEVEAMLRDEAPATQESQL